MIESHVGVVISQYKRYYYALIVSNLYILRTKMSDKRKILATSALIYANGPLHIGHLIEYIQTDVWCRFQKMRGHQCLYICGSDAHGTPIMLQARRHNISPEELIEKMHQGFVADFAEFAIEFDSFQSSHSKQNQILAADIYQGLEAHGDIVSKTIEQAFDPEESMFLPDRFVKGSCPKCSAEDQYGDSCENCGATYSPLELKNSSSVISGSTPIAKKSEHLFFDLPKYQDKLKQWIAAGHLQEQIANKLSEWFTAGLQQWDISRDAPYFGFEIPGHPGKYFYVWLDAPIAYLAILKEYCEQQNLDYNDFMKIDSDVELYHFIGKDIVYFHSLFWPAILMGSNLRTPTAIFAHGFLTINGKKMSKSRGTFIKARTYLNHLDAEYLRYYYAAKLNSHIEDIDLNMDDFQARVNSDLVGKVVNIASRCAKFINKDFNNQLAATLHNPELWEKFTAQSNIIAELYEKLEYNHAMREIMALADLANQYIDEQKPWTLRKQADQAENVQAICSMGLNLFKVLITYLKPVLPKLATDVEAFLNIPELTWMDSGTALLNHSINTFKPLMQRIEKDKVMAMLDEAQQEAAIASASQQQTENQKNNLDNGLLTNNPIKDTIAIDDFTKLDLRIVKIIQAEHVEGADKLLKLQVDIGGETRQIFSGIKKAFQPEDLIGKYTVIVANLAPRKMRFGLSEGMMIFAGSDGDLWLIEPQDGAQPGMPVQ